MLITTEHARLLLTLIEGGRAAMEQLRLSKLDNVSPELRAKLETEAAQARDRWDALAPETD